MQIWFLFQVSMVTAWSAWDHIHCRVSSSYFFLFFEPIFIFSYFKTKPSYFSYFLAVETKICNKIEYGIIGVCVFEWNLS